MRRWQGLALIYGMNTSNRKKAPPSSIRKVTQGLFVRAAIEEFLRTLSLSEGRPALWHSSTSYSNAFRSFLPRSRFCSRFEKLARGTRSSTRPPEVL